MDLKPKYAGKAWYIELTTQIAGQNADLTTAPEIVFSVKRSRRDADGAAIVRVTKSAGQIIVDSDEKHVAKITVPQSETADFPTTDIDYYWDLTIRDATSKEFVVDSGMVPVYAPVTISTT